jgi:protoporphyrin/coproporphyrin ferrochelatase
MSKRKAYLLTSFGEPRSDGEIIPYLQSFFRQEEPEKKKKNWLHRLFRFGKLRKETSRYRKECQIIDSFPPSYEQLIRWKEEVSKYLQHPIFCFFLHLPSTHEDFFDSLRECRADEYYLLPSFPQFSYAFTGQIAQFFSNHLKKEIVNRFRWIKSFAAHPAFVQTYQKLIQDALKKNHIKEEECILLFSCPGIDKKYLENGDLYESECEISFKEILKAFPFALGKLSFQNYYEIRTSPLFPSTYDSCLEIETWKEKRKKILLIPMGFLVESLATLYEMDQLYLPLLKKNGMEAYRISTLSSHPEWGRNSLDLFKEKNFVNNQMLLYSKFEGKMTLL